MAPTARGDNSGLRSAVMRMAQQVVRMRAAPRSQPIRPVTPGQSHVPMAPKAP